MTDNNDTSLPDYNAYKASVEAVHGGCVSNLTMGQRLTGGIETAPMSPVGCIDFFAEHGSNVGQLTAQLKIPTLARDFERSAAPPDDRNPTPSNFKPKV